MRRYVRKDHPMFQICKGYEKYIVTKSFYSYFESANLKLEHLFLHSNSNWARLFYIEKGLATNELVDRDYDLITGVRSKRNGDCIEGVYTIQILSRSKGEILMSEKVPFALEKHQIKVEAPLLGDGDEALSKQFGEMIMDNINWTLLLCLFMDVADISVEMVANKMGKK